MPLFLPGFAWSFVLLGDKQIWSLERIVISIGLSIAIVPLTVLLLNYLVGVAVTFLNVSLIIVSLIALAAVMRVTLTRFHRSSAVTND